MLDRQLQAMFGRTGTTSAERGAPEIENGQRNAQTFAERTENIFFRHAHVVQTKTAGGSAANAELRHAPFDHFHAGGIWRDQESGNRIFAWLARNRGSR